MSWTLGPSPDCAELVLEAALLAVAFIAALAGGLL
jgi:hypothetical protein